MKVIAKFKVTQITTYEEGNAAINLSAVYDPDENSENGKFFQYTPSGQIDLSIVTPETAKFFVPGQEYYVEFTIADDEE